MAGIESNPGPDYCAICKNIVNWTTYSVRCSKCKQWCHVRKNKHNNCSGLDDINKYTPQWCCPKCSKPSQQQQPATVRDNFKLLQFNCNGLRNKIIEILNFLKDNNFKIAAFQESKLNENTVLPELGDFELIRKDRTKDAGGGLAFLIHKNIKYQKLPDLPPDLHLETLGIKINDISIFNVYLPPVTSCSQGYNPDFSALLNMKDSIIIGDFNAHDALWFSSLSDARGNALAELIGDSAFGVLNCDKPTRIPTTGQPTSPDLSLASLSLLPVIEWDTITKFSSDHVPIQISIQADFHQQYSDRRTFVNFDKANWEDFTKLTEEEFSKSRKPTDVQKGEKWFRKIVNKVSKLCIPQGRIKSVYPEIPREAAELIKQRDELRSTDPTCENITQLNKDITDLVTNHRREKWRKSVEEIDRNCSAKLFKLIKRLNGKSCATGSQPIKFKGKYISNPSKIADKFNKQFTSVVEHKSSRTNRIITKNINKNKLDDHPTYTDDQTKAAIKMSKASKALGPDKISNLHLKHLGPKGITFLTDLFNLSSKTSHIPAIWKSSIIVPLPKPGKDHSDSKSYRPVSLLCPAIKILERLILPILTEHLTVPEFQHGFRSDHSTVTALYDFNEQVATGFNKNLPPDRTILVQLDLSKAFDMVSLEKLLKQLNETSLPGSVKRWIKCYLTGRQSKVHFRNKLSSSRNVRTGVPQGAVTSPLLFSFYLSKIPRPPDHIKIIQYADDISIYTSGTDIDKMTAELNKYLDTIVNYLEERELSLSPEKSTVTLFTSDRRQGNIHPQIKIKNTLVPLEKNPKLLGVHFDSHLTFSHHITKITDSVKPRINMMKFLAGSDWGQDKETLVITYKAVGRSLLEYGNPIWSPIIKPNNWKKLQTAQNQALRIATGCLGMSGIDHLHQETKVLPIKDHALLLTEQYVLAMHLPGHPGQKHLDRPPPERNMKPTAIDLKPNIRPCLPIIDTPTKKKGLKRLHTKAVKNVINKYQPNRVLGSKPPEIHKDELKLKRKARTKLSQLRSGFSRILNEYLNRISQGEIPNTCPDCNTGPHNVQHLFNCPAKPTTLTPIDLWKKPAKVANFLKLDGT